MNKSLKQSEEVFVKINDSLKDKVYNSITWFSSDEGKIISGAIASLGSLVVGDPTGIVLPVILASADLTIRKRFLKHFPDLAEKLNMEKSKMNEDFFKSDVGQDLLRETISCIVKEENEEKIEYLKKFLVNSYIQSDFNEQTKHQFFQTLSESSYVELWLLKILSSPEAYVEKIAVKLTPNDEDSLAYSMRENIRNYLNLDVTLYEKYVSNLKKNDCISDADKDYGWSNGAYKENYKVEFVEATTNNLKALVTDYGYDFIKFVTEKS